MAKARSKPKKARRKNGDKIREKSGKKKQTHSCADRAVFLADAERAKDHGDARRVRASLRHQAGEHRARRSVQAGVSRDLAEQPHARDRRSGWPRRKADLRLRVRCDPAISRPENRKILPPPTSAGAPRSKNGCSGRWAALDRWRDRRIISANTRRSKFPTP